jgi:tRNA(fMet)-specific endonuclease VapC
VKFLLDTNAVIGLLSGNAALNRKVRQHRPDDFGLSAIVAQELYFGAYRGVRQSENVHRTDQLNFEVIEFSREDARIAGALRAKLTRAGTPIGPYEVLIAGQALSRGLVLITHNIREFSRAHALRVEDWEE